MLRHFKSVILAVLAVGLIAVGGSSGDILTQRESKTQTPAISAIGFSFGVYGGRHSRGGYYRGYQGYRPGYYGPRVYPGYQYRYNPYYYNGPNYYHHWYR